MNRNPLRFKTKTYDVLVIGGGINGAAVANMASACGASVALIEKGDFACGTSSKSTKLLHGGIRYLENFEFDLVHESLRERYIQWQSVPHLVKPLSFIVPVYKKDKRPLWMMKLGVGLYDLLSGKYSLGSRRSLNAFETANLAPGITRDHLKGAVEYFDAQMDDARIVLENVLMAHQRGAEVANYVEAVDFIKENGRAVGVKAKDLITKDHVPIFAKTIICTVGPWSDQMRSVDIPKTIPLLRPTKGVHIIYKGQISPHAFLIQTQKDGRIFFIIPFRGNSLIGTTDTDFKDNPDDVEVNSDDVRYLLREASRVFGQIAFDQSKIIATFAGVRPLVAEKGQPSKISRKHVIEKTYSGIYYVMGGKYTTYRAIAQEVIEKALPQFSPKLPVRERYTLYGSGVVNEELKAVGARLGVTPELLKYLISIYGSKYKDVVDIIKENPLNKERLCSCSPAIAAQVIYARRVEMAMSVEDVHQRRLSLHYLDCPTRQCQTRIAELLKS